jgi:hypothetical protein
MLQETQLGLQLGEQQLHPQLATSHVRQDSGLNSAKPVAQLACSLEGSGVLRSRLGVKWLEDL